MKINYILSDTTKGATTNALKCVIKRAEENVFGDFVVIVPETKSIIIEKELLSLSKKHAFANIFVYSFVRLIKRLGFVSQDKIVTKQTCVMLIRKIIFDKASEFKCYQKTAKSVSFAEKVYDTIQQFKSSNVTVQDLKDNLQKCSKSLAAKLKDLILIYEAYESALSVGLFDDCDKLNLITKFAKTNNFIKNAEIFVVGFDNITYEMTSVLKELAKNSKEITFSCVYLSDKRKDAYIQNNELFKKFKIIGDELKYPYQPVFIEDKKHADFNQIKNKLFLQEQSASSGQIEVFEAKNRKVELDYIANSILCGVNDGARFKDFGIYACSLTENIELIKKCFDSYEIPYFINEEHDISSHVLARFIKNCFELYLTHLSADKVLKFLQSEFVCNKNTYSQEEFAEFENYAKEVGLNYSAFLSKLKFEDFEKTNSQEKFSRLNAVLLPFQEFYAGFETKMQSAKTIRDYLDIITFIFEYFQIKTSLEKISEFQKSQGDEINAQISLAIFDKCEEFGFSLANFMGDTEISANQMLQVYMSGFGAIKINLSPVSVDCVIIQDNTDGFFDIKYMFVMGAEENKFPAKLQDSGIILDSELEETKMHISKAVEPSVKDINARELFRVYEAFLEPTHKLYVSFVSQNKPARMVLRLISLFGEEIITKTYKRLAFASKRGAEMRFARNVNEYIQGEGSIVDINYQYSILDGMLSENFKRHLTQKVNGGEASWVLPSAGELYFPKKTTSISQLEKYFACPYLFFATYGLRLKENKVAKLSHLDIGSIVHRIAELFVGNILAFDNLSEPDFEAGVEKIAEQAFAEYKVNKSRNNAILDFILKEVKRLCKHLYLEQQRSSFKAIKNEYEFSGENAVKLNLDGEKQIFIEGKIDRIDKWGDYVRIIDYKTGDIKNDLASIYYGKKIQLVSYLSAVQGFSGAKVAGIFYFPIHSEYLKNDKKNIYKLEGMLLDDAEVLRHMDNAVTFENKESDLINFKIKTSKKHINENRFEISKTAAKVYFSEEEFENLKAYNTKLCEGAASEAVQGYIEPSPISYGDIDSSVCRFCEFRGFCGLDKARFKNGRKCIDKVSVSAFSENSVENAEVKLENIDLGDNNGK